MINSKKCPQPQGLFAVTVDRNRVRRFELVWDTAMERIERGEHKRNNAKA